MNNLLTGLDNAQDLADSLRPAAQNPSNAELKAALNAHFDYQITVEAANAAMATALRPEVAKVLGLSNLLLCTRGNYSIMKREGMEPIPQLERESIRVYEHVLAAVIPQLAGPQTLLNLCEEDCTRMSNISRVFFIKGGTPERSTVAKLAAAARAATKAATSATSATPKWSLDRLHCDFQSLRLRFEGLDVLNEATSAFLVVTRPPEEVLHLNPACVKGDISRAASIYFSATFINVEPQAAARPSDVLPLPPRRSTPGELYAAMRHCCSKACISFRSCGICSITIAHRRLRRKSGV